MIKKFIFIMSGVLFGFNTFAEIHSGKGVDHMSDMMHSGSSEADGSSLVGSVELKWTSEGFSEGSDHYPSLRARIGWKGDVNETLKWKVGLTSSREGRFLSPKASPDPAPETQEGANPAVAAAFSGVRDHALPQAYLEQAYVAYNPVDGFVVKVGQMGWKPKFHKTGVLYDDDVYSKGVLVKYYNGDDTGKFYVKAFLKSNPFYETLPNTPSTILKGKLGGKYALTSDIRGGAYVVADYGQLFGSNQAPATTLQVGLHFSASGMAIPVGVFGSWHTDAQNIGFKSFTGGAYVGQAGSPTSGEQGDFGVALSYYQVEQNDFRTFLMDTDYVTLKSEGKYHGVAARAQYNLWDKVNLVAKYALDLDAGDNNDGNNLVGELTFNF